jgi:uncharacterized protein YegL
MPPEHGPEPFSGKASATTPKRHRIVHSSRWWLSLAIVISVVIHLLLGIGGQHLGLFGSVQKPTPPERDPIEVTLIPTGAVKQPESDTARTKPTPAPPTLRPTKRANPVKPPRAPEREQPEVIRPTPVPPVTPIPATPSPSVAARPNPKRPTDATPPPVPPNRTPTQTVVTPRIAVRTPTTGGNLPDRLPEPLPSGDLVGIPNAPEVPRETRRPTTVRMTAAPKRASESGGGSAGGERRITENSTEPGTPVGPGEVKTGEGSGEGGVRGDARGTRAGAAAAIGIDRGIPFGDKLGIYGGNAAGGGGTGRGPGGAAADANVSNDGGKFRVSFKRTPSSESSGPAAKIAYVLDVSWSMSTGGKMNRAHEALNKALDELRPDDQFTIVTFANDARSTRMFSATRAGLSVGHANVSASQPEPGGATNLSAAIDLALGLPGITHVFILSDGEPTEGITDPNELLAFTRKKNTRKARIITMALINSDDKKGFTLLKEIAEQHNGLFDFVDVR